jgi:hypothetical protein
LAQQINQPSQEFQMNRTKTLLATAAAAAMFAAPAAFAQQQEGLITVNISNVANDIARNLSISVEQVPVTVQAPIDVAANVCGVAVNVLGTQGGSAAQCEANQTSEALNQIVQSQVEEGKGEGKGQNK